jgi:poly(A) polymerase
LAEDKRVSVAFILAILCWEDVDRLWVQSLQQGKKPVYALTEAVHQLYSDQKVHVFMPKKFLAVMREIWLSQPRFEQLESDKVMKLLIQSRFRAAFDFYCLRSEVGHADPIMAAWWTDFQTQTDDSKADTLLNLKHHKGSTFVRASMHLPSLPTTHQSPVHPKKRRPRKKKSTQNQGVDA